MKSTESIVVFEHETFHFREEHKKMKLDTALENYHGDGTPFFSLVKNGVKFNQHVGILKVGRTTIEILPKADRNEKDEWRQLLIDMIKTVWEFDVKTSGSADVKLRSTSVLDLYFELYVKELEYLLHQGLIKRYNRKEGNLTTLKGSLQFSRHISQNLVHKERFYVKYSHYDVNHKIHCILYKALKLIEETNNKPYLSSRIGTLLLNFPEMNDLKITESTFEKINYDRKNLHYENALQIAKLLLLNYHPDVSRGRNNVLALMFDMNRLWEQFVYVVLKKNIKHADIRVRAQQSKEFWRSATASSRMKPDIVLEYNGNRIVLDTKWKNLNGSHLPSPEDLRQMYAYHRYFKAAKTALVYPGEESKLITGDYSAVENDQLTDQLTCGIAFISTHKDIRRWKENIVSFVKDNFISSCSSDVSILKD
ncbi:McrC family protein [Chryseobacterium arthrosphaerae]|uniref:McrC family protein n=1 Tax=Chryseobacterium arthrosphaerae TaxID=651561 RepID=UPI001F4AAF4E|nr:McrC family protein [Chryseobacterium arthrosphaerae]MDG4653295.1 McrC family protein [Chryseobacterium arthrosphaerae]